MGMSAPSPLLVEGARSVIEFIWRNNKGKLPRTIDEIYHACRAYDDIERAAVCIAIQEFFPDHADNYRFPPTLDLEAP